MEQLIDTLRTQFDNPLFIPFIIVSLMWGIEKFGNQGLKEMIHESIPTSLITQGIQQQQERVANDGDKSNDWQIPALGFLVNLFNRKPVQSVDGSGVPPITTTTDVGATTKAEIEAGDFDA